jgi:hypothetical protein
MELAVSGFVLDASSTNYFSIQKQRAQKYFVLFFVLFVVK